MTDNNHEWVAVTVTATGYGGDGAVVWRMDSQFVAPVLVYRDGEVGWNAGCAVVSSQRVGEAVAELDPLLGEAFLRETEGRDYGDGEYSIARLREAPESDCWVVLDVPAFDIPIYVNVRVELMDQFHFHTPGEEGP